MAGFDYLPEDGLAITGNAIWCASGVLVNRRMRERMFKCAKHVLFAAFGLRTHKVFVYFT